MRTRQIIILGIAFILTSVASVYPSSSANSSPAGTIDGFNYLFDVEIDNRFETDVAVGRYEYKSADLTVQCEIIFPAPEQITSCRALVLCHGGIKGIPSRMREKALQLADDGYLVVMPSYRGEDGSEGEIEIACGEVDDVLACIDLLGNSDLVDSDRIAVIGSSHGALIAVLAAARDPEIPVVACAYGVLDIVGWWFYLQESDQYEEDELSRQIYGDGPLDHPEEFAQRSALRAACEIEPSVFILQGELDSLVPPEQAEKMVEAFDACGKENYKYTLYPGVGHGFLWWHDRDINRRGEDEINCAKTAWEDILDFVNEAWDENMQ